MNKRNIDYSKFYEKQPFSSGARSCDIGITFNTKAQFFSKWLGEAICNITDGVTCHVITKGKSGDVIEALGGGVTITKFSDIVKSDNSVLLFRNNNLTDDDKDNILSYLYGSVGRRYAVTGLFHFIFKGIKADARDNFCSENCCEGFATRNIKISDKAPEDTSPQDILDYMYLHGAFNKDPKNEWTLADNQNYNIKEILSFLKIKHGR